MLAYISMGSFLFWLEGAALFWSKGSNSFGLRGQSMAINSNDTSTSINTQLDSLIPASKIANLSQGMVVGAVADNFGEKIEQKIFHAQIIVNNDTVAKETQDYKPIPIITPFLDENGNDIMEEQISRNYDKIRTDVLEMIVAEKKRIKKDPKLKHLLPEEDE